MNDTEIRELLDYLIGYLADERDLSRTRLLGTAPASQIPTSELFSAFRALVNTRDPDPAPREFLEKQDRLLQGLIANKGISGLDDAQPSPDNPAMRLWVGNIVTFAADAIVNAANEKLLGCWQPNHHCIDNAIHTFAGVQLRQECARIMEEQGYDEPTGSAKVTGAYNLPASYVIHTVGPIAGALPAREQIAQLASCYTSCLDAAEGRELSSICFCSISTGVFGYPRDKAAHIATDTVRAWLDAHPESGMVVVFDVYSELDAQIYRPLLRL